MPSDFGPCFTNKLKNLGFRSYREYLASDLWQAKREEWKNSSLPQHCLACGHWRFNLHHRSYTRLGREQLLDLIPLCGECHSKVHEYSRAHNLPVQAAHKALRKIFGWTKSETARRFQPFAVNGNPYSWVDHEALKKPKSERGGSPSPGVSLVTAG